MTFKERVAMNIKKYRTEQGLTLKEVAKKCDMTEANLQKYESGNMKSLDVDTTYRIAKALDTTPEMLTGWTPDDRPLSPIEEDAYIMVERLKDRTLSKALKEYFKLSPEKKKFVVDTIYMLAKSD